MSERTPPIDQSWYERFQGVGSFQAYEYLDGDKHIREQEKQQFLRGDIEHPTLDYPRLDAGDLDRREQALLSLKQDVRTGEQDPMVRQLYRWKLNEKIAEVRLLRAASNGDMRRFHRYSRFVYGGSSPEVFGYTVNAVRHRAEGFLNADDAALRNAAAEMLDTFPRMEKPQTFSLPDQKAVSRARAETTKEMKNLISVPVREGMFTAGEMKTVFDHALETLGDEGWQVVIDPSSKTAVSVDQEVRRVKIPESRQVSAGKLQGLIVHEIGTHVARRINGERSRLMLLGLGLDRYEGGEEGVATMREQAMKGSVEEFAGFDKHLAISLAEGLDGKQRTFREVFDKMKSFYAFEALCSKKDLAASETEAQTKAWNTCVRVFRGTDCKTPGVAFTKDIIYTEGNIGVWNLVCQNPAEMMRFSVGKYDPTNPRHLWILDQLGITDADLGKLDK